MHPVKGKETKHVRVFSEQKLKSGENVVAFLEGFIGKMMGKGDDTQHNGSLILTDRRFAFYRKNECGPFRRNRLHTPFRCSQRQ